MRIGAEAIPAVAPRPAGDRTALFLGRGIATLREAARYLWALPYARVSPPNRRSTWPSPSASTK